MHSYAVQTTALSEDSRLSKLKRESRLEHLQAQQKDMLLRRDLGSMAIRFPDTVDRSFVLLYKSIDPSPVVESLGFGSPLLPRSHLQVADRDQAASMTTPSTQGG